MWKKWMGEGRQKTWKYEWEKIWTEQMDGRTVWMDGVKTPRPKTTGEYKYITMMPTEHCQPTWILTHNAQSTHNKNKHSYSKVKPQSHKRSADKSRPSDPPPTIRRFPSPNHPGTKTNKQTRAKQSKATANKQTQNERKKERRIEGKKK